MFPRKLEPIIVELLSDFRILYLTGPRQAGKTTLVKQIAKQLGMQYVTLDDQSVLAAVKNDPQGYIRSLGKKKLVLDEFQYAPGLIPAIKEASDALRPDEKGKFLLTGSADIFRSAKTQEALPGHLARVELYPLSITEIKAQSFNLVDYIIEGDFQPRPTPFLNREEIARLLLNGGYPEVQDKSQRSRQVWFKSYIEGRLYKDFEILYASRGDYHSKLSALTPYLAGLSGNLLKYASISNDLGLDDKLVKAYIEILDLMFISKRLPAYAKNPAKRLAIGMPKAQFVDTGLACHLLGLRQEEQLLQSQFYGGLLESFVFMEFCKHMTWAAEEVRLYHFRDKSQNEVDLVLEQDDAKIIGIEIKASATITPQDFKGLTKLAAYAGRYFEQGVLFYTGSEVLPFKQGDLVFHAIPLSILL
ncbi:MAG: AAA family ATPase [Deltaproteobacteria bacterium RIFOXYD12_FULL_50_9]|nr:MAG: AAA family ATPase [Deltaproteobacteria bacterium RIFOXYD12_FULL_50_9]